MGGRRSGYGGAAPHVGGGGALYLFSHTGARAASVEEALTFSMPTATNKSKDGRAIALENVGEF